MQQLPERLAQQDLFVDRDGFVADLRRGQGGDLRAEIKTLPGKGENYSEVFPIQDFFKEEFFKEKYVVYVQG